MTLAIEGIWRGGKIVPLEDVELEENTKIKVTINVMSGKGKTKSLAGAWKDYKTKDGKNLDDLKKEIYDGRKISLLKLAGVWKNDDATYNLFKRIYESRSAFKLRR